MDPKDKQIAQKLEHHDHRVEHFFRRVLHTVERLIAAVSVVVLLIALAMEVGHMVAAGVDYFSDVETYLHHILTIVVGLEFVRMLIDTTPASVLEVLTMAITRHMILSHDDYWSNVACVACIAGLFAIRRFLIPKNELREELVEQE